ncbi:hypothetical protein PRUPE_8G050500 [Prunus persica]|uniref:Uncharacterized protein n=1 Tax=Prunus persica TaxID=3760 RepID=A0A251MTD9_PRUPE|nr:hypothetical protein PRUPE_8G050500 [Prunus persica]
MTKRIYLTPRGQLPRHTVPTPQSLTATTKHLLQNTAPHLITLCHVDLCVEYYHGRFVIEFCPQERWAPLGACWD